MRILFFAHETNLAGGATRSLLNLLDGLKIYDAQPHVVVPAPGDLVNELEKRGIPVATVPFTGWVSKRTQIPVKFVKNVLLLKQLRKLISRWRIEIIYTNVAGISLGSLLAKMSQLPHIWHLRELRGIGHDLIPDCGNVLNQYLIKQSRVRITNSEAVKHYFFGTDVPSKTFVVYNGVATEERMRELLRNHDKKENCGTFDFVMLGGIRPHKRQADAVEAFAAIAGSFSEARLRIAGPVDVNAYEKKCRDLVKKHHLEEKVSFLGYLSDPFPILNASHAFLMCAEHEAMGRVTAEAMAACLPVIALNSGGTPELVRHEYSGLLYQGGAEELEACMRRFLENPDWAGGLGLNGGKIARERFTIENYSKQIFEILESITF